MHQVMAKVLSRFFFLLACEMQPAKKSLPSCSVVQVGQMTVNNRSCVADSTWSVVESCQWVIVTPLSRGTAGTSPLVLPQGNTQTRAVTSQLQVPQCSRPVYLCSMPPPTQQHPPSQHMCKPFNKIFLKALKVPRKRGKYSLFAMLILLKFNIRELSDIS